MTPADMQHASESAVLCEIFLGGYWCPDIDPALWLSTVDRTLLGICRELRAKRNLRFNLSAVVAAVRKLRDAESLRRLAEVVNPSAPHWWDGERHLQFHLKRLVRLQQNERRRRHALDCLAAAESFDEPPPEPQYEDPTPTLMDRQWNLRPERTWLDYPKQKPRLQLARA